MRFILLNCCTCKNKQQYTKANSACKIPVFLPYTAGFLRELPSVTSLTDACLLRKALNTDSLSCDIDAFPSPNLLSSAWRRPGISCITSTRPFPSSSTLCHRGPPKTASKGKWSSWRTTSTYLRGSKSSTYLKMIKLSSDEMQCSECCYLPHSWAK